LVKKITLLIQLIISAGEFLSEINQTAEKRDVYRIIFAMRQIVDALYKLRLVELNKYNISPEQASALICIHHLGKPTPTEISRWLLRGRHTASVLLKRLEKLGFIKMEPDQKNKHYIRITLTDKGERAYNDAIQFPHASKIITALPQNVRDQLYNNLQEMRELTLEELKLTTKEISGLTEAIMLPFSKNNPDNLGT
jgi:DNA-binding MarR family transcriptional regulator